MSHNVMGIILLICGLGMLGCNFLRRKRGNILVLALALLLPSIVRAQQLNLHPVQPGRKHAQIYPRDYSPAMCSVPSKDNVDLKYIRYCLTFAPKAAPACPAAMKARENRWRDREEGSYFEPFDCTWKPGTDPRKAAK